MLILSRYLSLRSDSWFAVRHVYLIFTAVNGKKLAFSITFEIKCSYIPEYFFQKIFPSSTPLVRIIWTRVRHGHLTQSVCNSIHFQRQYLCFHKTCNAVYCVPALFHMPRFLILSKCRTN